MCALSEIRFFTMRALCAASAKQRFSMSFPRELAFRWSGMIPNAGMSQKPLLTTPDHHPPPPGCTTTPNQNPSPSRFAPHLSTRGDSPKRASKYAPTMRVGRCGTLVWKAYQALGWRGTGIRQEALGWFRNPRKMNDFPTMRALCAACAQWHFTASNMHAGENESDNCVPTVKTCGTFLLLYARSARDATFFPAATKAVSRLYRSAST